MNFSTKIFCNVLIVRINFARKILYLKKQNININLKI